MLDTRQPHVLVHHQGLHLIPAADFAPASLHKDAVVVGELRFSPFLDPGKLHELAGPLLPPLYTHPPEDQAAGASVDPVRPPALAHPARRARDLEAYNEWEQRPEEVQARVPAPEPAPEPEAPKKPAAKKESAT